MCIALTFHWVLGIMLRHQVVPHPVSSTTPAALVLDMVIRDIVPVFVYSLVYR